ncbi:wax ester synthase/diacylglycerol acyltransferase 6-like [Magnolia sinica]|uniref:wax ester synthase/diacylglycerol acyltransferase 6-like n=1 Tax=Magnolia sinica TaxID=86752 RepID=UPI002659B857|nr:wax ester synthase/diacylglycerol acyltransferase 6-like [Magnolia sinica]
MNYENDKHTSLNLYSNDPFYINNKQALADMMEKEKTDAEWGNWLGYIILPFSIQMRDDLLGYIHKAKEIVDYSYEFFLLHLRNSKVDCAFSFMYNKQWHQYLSVLSNMTMSFSNIIGPLEEISFYGHPIVYLAPSVYGHLHVSISL